MKSTTFIEIFGADSQPVAATPPALEFDDPLWRTKPGPAADRMVQKLEHDHFVQQVLGELFASEPTSSRQISVRDAFLKAVDAAIVKTLDSEKSLHESCPCKCSECRQGRCARCQAPKDEKCEGWRGASHFDAEEFEDAEHSDYESRIRHHSKSLAPAVIAFKNSLTEQFGYHAVRAVERQGCFTKLLSAMSRCADGMIQYEVSGG